MRIDNLQLTGAGKGIVSIAHCQFSIKKEVTLDRFSMYSEPIKGHFIEFLISNIFG